MNDKLKKIIENFNFDGEIIEVVENNQGNINTTYMLKSTTGKKYLLQKINIYVFKDPHMVMKNIELVTTHITKKLEKLHDGIHKTLNIIKTKSNQNMYIYTNQDGEKEYYRVFLYIDDCISFDNFKECNDSEMTAYNTGKCFGFFHKLLSDFPTNLLGETIPNFHNTTKRFKDFITSIESDILNRADNTANDIVYLITKIKECSCICESLEKKIPIRVTHNDTKLNNVLFDKNTKEGIAVIDLDTVMPGSVLFDIGDGIRSACANAFEDEVDLSKVFLNLDLTKSYLKGYVEEMKDSLTKEEISYIGLSIKTITYELTLRFLTDYLSGDIYFKIKYPEHNKDRYKNQLTLLKDIESKLEEIDTFVSELTK